MSAWDRAISIVLAHEGGYVNDPADPGGETKFGISKRAYPSEDIRHLTLERAMSIYHRDYWAPVVEMNLPDPVAIMMFDMAVNMGRKRAAICLQEAVGTQPDGMVGPITQRAVRAQYSRDLLGEITVRRVMFYQSLPTFERFGLGWTRRAVQTLLAITGGENT